MPNEIVINEVSFGYTINTGDGEYAKVSLKAQVNRGQQWQSILEELRALVGAECSMERAAAEARRGGGGAEPRPFESVIRRGRIPTANPIPPPTTPTIQQVRNVLNAQLAPSVATSTDGNQRTRVVTRRRR